MAIGTTIFLNIAGALFKIQHWPGANIMMIGGILSPLVLFLPVYLYFYKSDEHSLNLNNFFSVLFLLVLFSILDALLTTRISKETLDMPIHAMYKTNTDEYLYLKKDLCYNQLLNDSVYSEKQKIRDIKTKSDALNQVIDSIKYKIIYFANKREKGKTNDYLAIKLKDNFNIPSFVLFNEDKLGNKLQKGIDEIRDLLLSVTKNSSSRSNYILQLLQMDKKNYGKTWIQNEFSGNPVAFALFRLKTIQENIAFAEIETLNFMCQGLKK